LLIHYAPRLLIVFVSLLADTSLKQAGCQTYLEIAY
jgi:hypothetical protein